MLDIGASKGKTGGQSFGSSLLGIGTGVAGGLLSMIGQKKREKRSNQNTKDLMDKQMSNQMRLNEQGKNLSMELWKDTNYGAQMEEMRKAGLNTALMYGQGSGGGGSTSLSGGGSASSGSAAQPQPMEIGQMVSAAKTAAELAMMKASTRDTNANAERTEIDNDITVSHGKETRKAELSNRYQEATGKDNVFQVDPTVWERKFSAEVEKVEIDKEIADLVRKGQLSENDVKAYKAKLARAQIDPDSNPVIRELMKAMAAEGKPLSEVLRKVVRLFID